MQDQLLFPLKRKTRLQLYVFTARRVAYAVRSYQKSKTLSLCSLFYSYRTPLARDFNAFSPYIFAMKE